MLAQVLQQDGMGFGDGRKEPPINQFGTIDCRIIYKPKVVQLGFLLNNWAPRVTTEKTS